MTILITGANRGLGYGTALTLAADTTQTLALVGRDLIDLKKQAGRIQAATGNANLAPMQLDLADLSSVRDFVEDYHARKLPPLKVLICNAGVSFSTGQRHSVDGYEETFAVNHLGHFLLVNLLLDALEPPVRVLVVSSAAHDPGVQKRGPMAGPRYVKAEWLAYPERDPYLPKDDSVVVGQAYASSKLCNLLFTYELSRRLEASGLSTPMSPITVNAFAPGLVAGTGLGRDGGLLIRMIWYYLLPAASRLMGFGRSARQAGADLAHLAVAPELEGVTGKFFIRREMSASSEESYDLHKAADLWETSVQLTRLLPHESPLLAGSSS
jgi:NAD(P)-dependent dehydrogenase (short-subunit alcohol dehydrogenase family)